MKKYVLLSSLSLLLLISLAAAPVLAATTVTCPSSCSCLLPAEAKKIGSPGYCQGLQKICEYDSQKNEKYCYQKPVTTTSPQLSVTGFKVVTTTPTTVAPQKCASGCTCLSSADGKGKGLLYCGGKQTLCGGTDKAPMYCFTLPTTATTKTVSLVVTGFHVITTTPALHEYSDNSFGNWSLSPIPCTAPCTCLEPDAAKASGLSRCSVNATLVCGYSTAGKAEYCYTPDRTTGLSSAAGTTITSTLPACPAGCACLATDKAGAVGLKRCGNSTSPCDYDPIGREMQCYAVEPAGGMYDGMIPSADRGMSASPPKPEVNILSFIGSMVSSFFGGTQTIAGPASGPSISCTAGRVLCNGTCIDVTSDRTNCGGCNRYCYGLEQCCNGVCTDVFDDPDNCMMCGNSCPGETLCWNRSCIRTGCGESLTNCDGACVQTRTDPENCGYCGHRCGDAQICVNAVCTNCFTGTIRCGDYIQENRCVDPKTSFTNCGECRHTCSSGEVCSGERCTVCPEGTNSCFLVDASVMCVDLRIDETNCGSCRNFCDEGEHCIDGECRSQGLASITVVR